MLAFDAIRAMSHDFLRALPYITIPPKLYKKSEAVVKRESQRQKREETGVEQHQRKS